MFGGSLITGGPLERSGCLHLYSDRCSARTGGGQFPCPCGNPGTWLFVGVTSGKTMSDRTCHRTFPVSFWCHSLLTPRNRARLVPNAGPTACWRRNHSISLPCWHGDGASSWDIHRRAIQPCSRDNQQRNRRMRCVSPVSLGRTLSPPEPAGRLSGERCPVPCRGLDRWCNLLGHWTAGFRFRSSFR